MISLSINPSFDNNSQNYRAYDGLKVRESLISQYIKYIANMCEQDSLEDTDLLHKEKKTAVLLKGLLTDYQLNTIVNQTRKEKTGAFKFDVREVTRLLAYHIDNFPITVEYDSDLKTQQGMTNFDNFTAVIQPAFKFLATRDRKPANIIANMVSPNTTNEIKNPNSNIFLVEDSLNDDINVELLREHYKVILSYIYSLKKSLEYVHRKKITDTNYIPKQAPQKIVPISSVYRLITAAWLSDRDDMFHDSYTAGKYVVNMTAKNITQYMKHPVFVENGYFIEKPHKDSDLLIDRLNNSILPRAEYRWLFYPNKENCNDNMMKKAFLEMKTYYQSEFISDKFNIDVYASDRLKLFRDLYVLLCSCKDRMNNKLEIFNKIKYINSETRNSSDKLHLTIRDVTTLVLGTDYDLVESDTVVQNSLRDLYSGILPLVQEIPEEKFNRSFWEDTSSIDEWFQKDISSKKPVNKTYNIPKYDFAESVQAENIQKGNPNFSHVHLLNNYDGMYSKSPSILESLYLMKHLTLLESFFLPPSSNYNSSTMEKLFTSRYREMNEYEIFCSLKPESKNDLLITEIDSELSRKNIAGYSLYENPVTDSLNVTVDLADLTSSTFTNVFKNNRPLVDNLVRLSPHMEKFYKDYCITLVTDYLAYLLRTWKTKDWSIYYATNPDLYLQKMINTMKYYQVNNNPNLKILHLLSKPLVINDIQSVKDLGIAKINKNVSTDTFQDEDDIKNVYNDFSEERTPTQYLIAKVTVEDNVYDVLLSTEIVYTNKVSDKNQHIKYYLTIPSMKSDGHFPDGMRTSVGNNSGLYVSSGFGTNMSVELN